MAPKRMLLVEGEEDKRIIPYLVEANGIPWETENGRIVEIDQLGGVENLLAEGVIEVYLKGSETKLFGILVDADEDCAARWVRIRNRCKGVFENLPEEFPDTGLIIENADGLRLGVWIMPDNRSSGMIETFLTRLIPAESQALRDYARKCLVDSRQHDASWVEAHHDKALVHTWLAWQNPPGHQLHTAIVANQLKPNTESATAFMRWFCDLYQIENE